MMSDGTWAHVLVLALILVLLGLAGLALLRSQPMEAGLWEREATRLTQVQAALSARIEMLPQPDDLRHLGERLARVEEGVRGVGESVLKTEGMMRLLLDDRLRWERPDDDEAPGRGPRS